MPKEKKAITEKLMHYINLPAAGTTTTTMLKLQKSDEVSFIFSLFSAVTIYTSTFAKSHNTITMVRENKIEKKRIL